MSFPPGTYRACFVPQQTGYPTASQQVNRATQVLSNAAVFIQQPVNFGAVVAVTEPPGPQQAYDAWQAVLAYEAFRTQMAQQSVAEQPQYIRFVGTPEDIALLRQELERGRPVQFVQQLQGGALGPLVTEIETQSISTASRPTISDADDSSGGVRFRGPNGEFTYDEVKLEQPAFFGVRDWNVPDDRQPFRECPRPVQRSEIIKRLPPQEDLGLAVPNDIYAEEERKAAPIEPGSPDDFGANREKYDFERLDQRLKEAGVLGVESKDGALRLTIAPLTKEQLINFSSEIVRYADLAVRLGKPALDGDRRIVEMARRFAGGAGG